MKAEEAQVKSIKTREQAVPLQLADIHKAIAEATEKGGFSVTLSDHSYKSTRYLGWLGEVVKKLEEEGYTVYLYRGHLEIGWLPSNKVINEESRPVKEPDFIERSWWKVW